MSTSLPDPKPQEQPPRDRTWLRNTLTRLLAQAANTEDPDHQACAKYADLLWKMLPQDNPPPSHNDFDALRHQILYGEAPPLPETREAPEATQTPETPDPPEDTPA